MSIIILIIIIIMVCQGEVRRVVVPLPEAPMDGYRGLTRREIFKREKEANAPLQARARTVGNCRLLPVLIGGYRGLSARSGGRRGGRGPESLDSAGRGSVLVIGVYCRYPVGYYRVLSDIVGAARVTAGVGCMRGVQATIRIPSRVAFDPLPTYAEEVRG
jgi:hypothetical protein